MVCSLTDHGFPLLKPLNFLPQLSNLLSLDGDSALQLVFLSSDQLQIADYLALLPQFLLFCLIDHQGQSIQLSLKLSLELFRRLVFLPQSCIKLLHLKVLLKILPFQSF